MVKKQNLKDLIRDLTLRFQTVHESKEKILENEFVALGKLVEFIRETGEYINDSTKELLKELINALIKLQGKEINFYNKKVEGYWLSYMEPPEEFVRYPDVSGLSTARVVAFLTVCFLKIPNLSVEIPNMVESLNRGIKFIVSAFGEGVKSAIISPHPSSDWESFTDSLLFILTRGLVPFYIAKSKIYKKSKEFKILLEIFIEEVHKLEQAYYIDYFRAYGKLPPELSYLETDPRMKRFLSQLHKFLYPEKKYYDDEYKEEIANRKLKVDNFSIKEPELLKEIKRQFRDACFSIEAFENRF
ncbi:MAG: hypothetical protein ABGX27_05550 [Desulfurobacteriaceae bacterium]